jgi:hypothetical protein
MRFTMNDIKRRWKNFANIILDPWSIILIAGTVVLSIVLLNQNDKVIIIILTFIISVASGILGGILGKRWEDLTEERIIAARGKSAVRDLKLLLGNIALLEERVHRFTRWHADAVKKDNSNHEVIAVNLEEIIGRCNMLEEQAINSVENWTDVVPEANVSTQIGIITDLKRKTELLEADVRSLNNELGESKDKSAEEIKKLQGEKRQKEKELENARQELRNRSWTLNIPPASGSAYLGATGPIQGVGGLPTFSPSESLRFCSNCGKAFTEPSGTVTLYPRLCPDCRVKQTTQTTGK